MSDDYKTLTFEKPADGIGLVRVNRPDKLNALNEEVLRELLAFFSGAENLRGLILSGAGEKAFIAGADIAAMETMDTAAAAAFSRLGQEVTLALEKLPFPVIACVNGFALGGGCEMAMSCDLIFATEGALFGQPEVKLGLIPGFGGTRRLSAFVGRGRAKEIIYSARNVKAQEALELGLVQRLFPDRQSLLDGAVQMLQKMGKNSPAAIAAAKRAINGGEGLPVGAALDREREEFSHVFGGSEMKEGVRAFLEKRPPNFGGPGAE